ncbi:MAG: RDD family protein [Planctomycetota bacterium]
MPDHPPSDPPDPFPPADASPWAPPSAVVADVVPTGRRRLVLATPGQRLAGYLVDTLLGNVAAFVGVVPAGIVMVLAEVQDEILAALVVYGGAGLASILWLALQAWLLARDGATVGKRLVRTRIVRADGSRASVARSFWVRLVLFNFVVGVVGVFTFFLGSLVLVVVDGLMVFSRHRRTLKDRWADTVVVQA